MKKILQIAAGIILATVVLWFARLLIVSAVLTASLETINTSTRQAMQQVQNRPEPRRIVGYREIWVSGRPLAQCLGADKELNASVVRCRNGYIERVPVYNK